MNQGGITERLIGFCNKIVGHITGGLAIANVVAPCCLQVFPVRL